MEKKLECEIVQDLLLSFFDGVLNKSSKELVEKHLLECENCQKKLDDIKTDAKMAEHNQEQAIDYLKKLRRNNRIKSIFIAIGIIIILLFIIYIYKFIQINLIAIRGIKSLGANNFYKETIQSISNNEALLKKDYFKDGKYKSISEKYVDGELESSITKYSNIDSDETILVDVSKQKYLIEKGEAVKQENRERNLKYVPFVLGLQESIITRMGIAFTMSILTDIDETGKEYYVLKDEFEKSPKWELWIDKETGLPVKEFIRDGVRSYWPNTHFIKFQMDNIHEFRYEFGIVTDEDVNLPDLSEYEIEYVYN